MKIGLFGGTFDPLHWGHIKLAEEAKNVLSLDKMIFIPSGEPPHKQGRQVTAKHHRLAMAKLGAKIVGAEVSPWEMEREGRSYSLETVQHFKECYPNDELFFVIGADSFRDLPLWWHYRELMALCQFVVVTRPDVPKESLLSRFAGDEKPPRVFFLDRASVDISSTEIRKRLSEGKDIKDLVPPEVLSYIKTKDLYTEDGGNHGDRQH